MSQKEENQCVDLMEQEYKNFIIITDIKQKSATTWIVTVSFKKKNYEDEFSANIIPSIIEEFTLHEGALNAGIYMQQKAQDKVDAYLSNI
ncbi:hypothetical protein [Kosakonia sp. YIM B13611]|uniref:hypothetical protein n=1 Tax=unclassified Kosakonia TaxID=2632876 RepID=UPI0036AD69C0